jgi:hypothetical protein
MTVCVCVVVFVVPFFGLASILFPFLNTELKQWSHKQLQQHITQNIYSS